jgi:hypothetical protein
MGYIGKITRVDKKNKYLWIDGEKFNYTNVVRWAEKHPVGEKISYSHHANNITWIGKATPEYIRIAKELKKRYGKKKGNKVVIKKRRK